MKCPSNYSRQANSLPALCEVKFDLIHNRALPLPKDMKRIIKFISHASSDCSIRVEEPHPATLTDEVINRMVGRKPQLYFEFRVSGLEFFEIEAHQFPYYISTNELEIRALFDSGQGRASISMTYEKNFSS